ncbi:hypothetical protein MBLNU457_7426t1 [Dothideomycetes sp. NU457]
MGSRLEKKSDEVRKRIENHTFNNEEGDEYEGSKFGGFTDYFRRKKIKLQNLDHDLREKSADKPKIFRGIVAHVNGYTQPSLNDLHELIVSHGGGFIQYLDGKTMVTHIIASNLTPKKAVEFKRYRIVKPAWIVDSVKAGRLLPWNEYRVVDEGVGQKVLGFDNGQVVTQTNNKVRGYRDQTDASWYTSQLAQQQYSASKPPPAKQPSFTQTLTPGDDDINDSDFERLEEQSRPVARPPKAAKEIVDDFSDFDEDPQEERTHEDNSSLRTPPRTSPPVAAPAESALSTDVPSPLPEQLDEVPREDIASRGTKRSRSPEAHSPSKTSKLTAEEHNAILLADPRLRKSTVVNPEFLEQYYRESRLHHLSTWKADLKSQLQALTAEKSSSQKVRQKRPPGARRYIMHVDFDSFFVAVSLKKCPQYKDVPCVVAHGGGSGSEIASCNYPARKYGISNGMWMKRAQELYPDLKVLPYDFPAYEEASRKFYDAILATGGVVQSVSIDEALIDISAQCIAAGGTDGVRRAEGSNFREQSRADEIGDELRKTVLDLTGCNVSVGIGSNILLAKVALRKAKPAGQFQLKPEDVLDFIGGLEVQSLPGVAWSMGSKLEEIGIRYVKDIREFTREKLINTLGPKTGEKIWEYARGIDRAEVGEQVIRKSVSAEVNWGVRFENQEQVDEFLENLCGELQKRLIKERVKGRQLTLKVMRRSPDAPLDPPKHLGHGKCDTYNKSTQLGIATNDAKLLTKETLSLMRGFGFTPGELRGIGVQMQKLEPLKADGPVEGSQRRLQFMKGEQSRVKPPEKRHEPQSDPIQDEVETPKPKRVRDAPSVGIPLELLKASPSKKPLNMMGTQFALPTQVDPSVLAALPEDIRSRLIRQSKPKSEVAEQADLRQYRDESPVPPPRERTESPAIGLPNESQLDAETLAALPEDVRAEVLAQYHKSPHKAKGQAVLPQSPRKNRVAPISKGPLVRKRGRGGLFGAIRRGDNSTLTQSNFVARAQSARDDTPTDNEGEAAPAELDKDFLAALPDELRQEVIEQHRQQRLRKTGGIDLSMHQKPRGRRTGKNPKQEAVERLFKLPPTQPKPTFTKEKLSELPDLRAMIKDWVREFWDDEPFAEDIKALVSYLRAVVADERDIAKSVKIVKWLAWTVEQESEGKWQGDEMLERWDKVLAQVREGVQQAVRERGLGAVDLG